MTARTLTLLVLGAAALTACSQPAPRPPQPVGVPATVAPADRFVAAIESEGCVLTSSNVGAVLLRSNLTQAELPALTTQLEAQGRIEPSTDNSIRVLSDNCI
ncbi:hypothetical protein [Rubellimicrobium arenae]|uniref:hypothetical protein n=1 Tax=Rubellimicrobium arenae TaxID=2817372 RepID=UPI001B31103F|nr:hypothetical protein [Rubellimicrobium arenae]